jgi:hypothetical protein
MEPLRDIHSIITFCGRPKTNAYQPGVLRSTSGTGGIIVRLLTRVDERNGADEYRCDALRLRAEDSNIIGEPAIRAC